MRPAVGIEPPGGRARRGLRAARRPGVPGLLAGELTVGRRAVGGLADPGAVRVPARAGDHHGRHDAEPVRGRREPGPGQRARRVLVQRGVGQQPNGRPVYPAGADPGRGRAAGGDRSCAVPPALDEVIERLLGRSSPPAPAGPAQLRPGRTGATWCWATGAGHRAAGGHGLLEDALGERGLAVRRNERYPGGWTVRRFAGHERVDAIQVELNQRRYLDLGARVRPGAAAAGGL